VEPRARLRLIKEIWACGENRIAVRSRTSGTRLGKLVPLLRQREWEFDAGGLMRRRIASINDVPIAEADRKYHWNAPGPRPRTTPD